MRTDANFQLAAVAKQPLIETQSQQILVLSQTVARERWQFSQKKKLSRLERMKLTFSLNNYTLMLGWVVWGDAMTGIDDDNAKDDQMDEPRKTISAQELFDGEREILIEHDGEMYRLRITRRNKLILQK